VLSLDISIPASANIIFPLTTSPPLLVHADSIGSVPIDRECDRRNREARFRRQVRAITTGKTLPTLPPRGRYYARRADIDIDGGGEA